MKQLQRPCWISVLVTASLIISSCHADGSQLYREQFSNVDSRSNSGYGQQASSGASYNQKPAQQPTNIYKGQQSNAYSNQNQAPAKQPASGYQQQQNVQINNYQQKGLSNYQQGSGQQQGVGGQQAGHGAGFGKGAPGHQQNFGKGAPQSAPGGGFQQVPNGFGAPQQGFGGQKGVQQGLGGIQQGPGLQKGAGFQNGPGLPPQGAGIQNNPGGFDQGLGLQGSQGLQQGAAFQQEPLGLQQGFEGPQQGPGGFQADPLAFQQGPDEFQQGLGGLQQGPADLQKNPNSFQQGPAGFQQDPINFQQGPAGFQQDTNNFQQGPAGFKQDPNSFQQGSAGFQQDPNSFQKGPADLQQNPNSFQQGTVGLQQDPNSFQQGFQNGPGLGQQDQFHGQGPADPTLQGLTGQNFNGAGSPALGQNTQFNGLPEQFGQEPIGPSTPVLPGQGAGNQVPLDAGFPGAGQPDLGSLPLQAGGQQGPNGFNGGRLPASNGQSFNAGLGGYNNNGQGSSSKAPQKELAGNQGLQGGYPSPQPQTASAGKQSSNYPQQQQKQQQQYGQQQQKQQQQYSQQQQQQHQQQHGQQPQKQQQQYGQQQQKQQQQYGQQQQQVSKGAFQGPLQGGLGDPSLGIPASSHNGAPEPLPSGPVQQGGLGFSDLNNPNQFAINTQGLGAQSGPGLQGLKTNDFTGTLNAGLPTGQLPPTNNFAQDLLQLQQGGLSNSQPLPLGQQGGFVNDPLLQVPQGAGFLQNGQAPLPPVLGGLSVPGKQIAPPNQGTPQQGHGAAPTPGLEQGSQASAYGQKPASGGSSGYAQTGGYQQKGNTGTGGANAGSSFFGQSFALSALDSQIRSNAAKTVAQNFKQFMGDSSGFPGTFGDNNQANYKKPSTGYGVPQAQPQTQYSQQSQGNKGAVQYPPQNQGNSGASKY